MCEQINQDQALTTRKRRRLARKFYKEEPLFAFHRISEMVSDYNLTLFIRDIKPTQKSKFRKSKIRKQVPARWEFHQEMVRSLNVKKPSNKLITKILLNHENKAKAFPYKRKFGEKTFLRLLPVEWNLTQVRSTILEMEKIKDLEALQQYWKEATKYSCR